MNRPARSHEHHSATQPHAAAACLSWPQASAAPRLTRSQHPQRPSVRVLVIPGLRDSGDAHWQTWLQSQYVDAARVTQRDWHQPELSSWSERIGDTLARSSRHTLWVAVAHSFGCLALAHHLAHQLARQATSRSADGIEAPTQARIVAALMVAPADPVKFGLSAELHRASLGLPLTVIGSEDDPWMPLERARDWAHTWGGGFVNLGRVGHINTESGFGPWPLARQKVDHLVRQQQRLHTHLCGLACDTP